MFEDSFLPSVCAALLLRSHVHAHVLLCSDNRLGNHHTARPASSVHSPECLPGFSTKNLFIFQEIHYAREIHCISAPRPGYPLPSSRSMYPSISSTSFFAPLPLFSGQFKLCQNSNLIDPFIVHRIIRRSFPFCLSFPFFCFCLSFSFLLSRKISPNTLFHNVYHHNTQSFSFARHKSIKCGSNSILHYCS